MTDLDRFPSLQAFAEQIDAQAERDARRDRDRGAWRSWRPRLLLEHAPAQVVTAVAVVALIAATYAVPITRAAVGDVYDSLAGWVSGNDDAAPGTPVGADDSVPSWVAAEDGEKRVLAEADGERLYVIRDGRKLTLALNDFGQSGTVDSFRRGLSGQRIQLVSPGHFVADGHHDRRALFGLVSSTVTRIRYTYADGGPSQTADNLSGAFGIVVDANRKPSALLGYDAAGNVVARVSLVTDPKALVPNDASQSFADFRYCPGAAAACPAWQD
jgi:hypothetical protein